jgi:osmotically-inducible protein OsmY
MGRYSSDERTEEDRDYFDKYSITGESEWTRGSTTPFEDEEILIRRSYRLGGVPGRHGNSQFSREFGGALGHAGKGPKNYHKEDDRISEDVADALLRCPEVDATEIQVQVSDGVVTLIGKVQDRLSKKVAERAVEDIPGVFDVRNELSFRRKGSGKLLRPGVLDQE